MVRLQFEIREGRLPFHWHYFKVHCLVVVQLGRLWIKPFIFVTSRSTVSCCGTTWGIVNNTFHFYYFQVHCVSLWYYSGDCGLLLSLLLLPILLWPLVVLRVEGIDFSFIAMTSRWGTWITSLLILLTGPLCLVVLLLVRSIDYLFHCHYFQVDCGPSW